MPSWEDEATPIQTEDPGSWESSAVSIPQKKKDPESSLRGWITKKMEQQKKRADRPFLRALMQDLGNAPLGPMGPVTEIARVFNTGDKPLSSFGLDIAKKLTPLSLLKLLPDDQVKNLVSLNAPTLASMVKGGIVDPALGVTQIASRATGRGVEPVQKAVDETHKFYGENFDQSQAGEGAGGFLTAGVGREATAGNTVLTQARKLARVGKSSLKGGAVAAGSTPETVVKDDADFWYRKGLEFALGSVLGGGADATVQVAKGNPLARTFGPEEARNAALATGEEIRQATKSKKFPGGAEPSLGEILQSPNIQKIENATEYIPFSGAKNRLSSQNAAVSAKLEELTADAATKTGPAGAGASIMESARELLKKRKGEYGVKYDEIRDVVDSSGARATPKEALNRAYVALHELEQTTGNERAISDIQNLILQLESGGFGDTFGKLQGERRGMMRKIRDLLNSGSPDANLARHRQSIADGFGSDMDRTLAMADPSGRLGQQFADTNKGYARDVIAYRPDQPSGLGSYRPEAKILHGRELFSDKTAGSILQGDNPQMAQYVKRGTGQEGHEAVQGAITQSIDRQARGEAGFVSPRKGASAIEKHKNFIAEFFPQAGRDEILGFGKAMAALERSGQFMERLQTGKFAAAIGGQIGVGAGMVANPGATVATVAGVRLFNKLSSSKAGKEWLLNAAKQKPDSPGMQALIRDLPMVLGVGAGDTLDELR